MRNEIRDTRNFVVGWSEETPTEIRYFGFTQGYIGRFDKNMKRWFWMKGPKIGQLGPMGDIGFSEVLKAERTN